MRKFTLADLAARGSGPVFAPVVDGHLIDRGGVSSYGHGERTHPEGYHTHDVPEVFCVLQGSGLVEIDGETTPFEAGDVLVIEPGEDHHLISLGDVPLVHAWMHLREN
ncbi:cupin domain-containing protein [Phytomonospora sp. NPDC050363]|uniref:cupin domain-containing protein n=1 Tax=Phytomonospora sp. NPDC050363 TaxID=3155642 RepID=UPI00340B1892